MTFPPGSHWSLLFLSVLGLAATGFPEGKSAAPTPLDFRAHFTVTYTGENTRHWLYEEFHGPQVIDGLPFQVDGTRELYGTANAQWHRGQKIVRQFGPIPVRRAFDELHLIHEARWREYSGCTIAQIRLRYVDGTTADLPIRYGAQVLDISRLPSEETEQLTDADSKIIWRGRKETDFGCNYRLFKSRLTNPHPAKVVASLEVTNTQTRASYVLVAATVASRDPQRRETPGLPLNVPARTFDAAVRLEVRDAESGQPLDGADVYPNMFVASAGVIGDPILTSATGAAIIKYPSETTRYVGATVSKDGYQPESVSWSRGRIPATNVIRLLPAPTVFGGRVLDDAGAPVAEAEVSVSLIFEANASRDYRPGPPVTTDSEGRWRVANLPKEPGALALHVRHPDYAEFFFYTGTNAVVAGIARVALSNLLAGDAVLTLPRGVEVLGTVVGANGEAVEGAKVQILDLRGAGAHQEVTDADGAFRIKGVKAGPKTIRVLAPRHLPSEQKINVRVGMDSLEFTLEPAGK